SGAQPSAPPPVSMSETGSFHLAPPPAPAPAPAPAQQQPYAQTGFQQAGLQQPPPAAPFTTDAPPPYAVGAPHPSQAPTSGLPHDSAATRAYTAQQQHPPVPAPPVQHAAPHAPARRTRPGPPPKVAAGVLVAALICFAVGIWALTQV
ncbi:serine/threonine protein kinase, partial [Streptomyces sp. RHZ10]|nr:serine/threonine protein kinase [Streptomyces durocortorensis]